MHRLRHSNAGFLRYMQMSSAQVFVFVEGKQADPFFYGQICDSVAKATFLSFEVCTARELPLESGGKMALFAFFSYLRLQKGLLSTLAGKKTSTLFYVDKDVDDVLRRRKRSAHLVYTEYYDVQNHIFENGDVLRGAAAAASIAPQLLRPALSDPSWWCRQAATKWKDWVKLCMFAKQEDIRCQANYHDYSPINSPPSANVDAQKRRAWISTLREKSELSSAVFETRFASASNRVDTYFRRGEHHKVFKGKWFAHLLADEIKHIMGARPYDSKGLATRLPSAVAATLDFDADWAEYFKAPLDRVISALSGKG